MELYIPITYIVQNSLSDVKRAWLKSDSILTIPKSSPNQWILVNVGQTGKIKTSNIVHWKKHKIYICLQEM